MGVLLLARPAPGSLARILSSRKGRWCPAMSRSRRLGGPAAVLLPFRGLHCNWSFRMPDLSPLKPLGGRVRACQPGRLIWCSPRRVRDPRCLLLGLHRKIFKSRVPGEVGDTCSQRRARYRWWDRGVGRWKVSMELHAAGEESVTVAKLTISSPFPGATLPGWSLRRAVVSAAGGGGCIILGRLVRCSPSRICCLANSRTTARSAWGARVGPPQVGHSDPALRAHPSVHSRTRQSWTSGSPMLLVGGPRSGALGGCCSVC